MKDVDPKTGVKSKKKLILLVLCEEDSSNVVIYKVESESIAEVEPIFKRHVHNGSIAHTDGAPAYAKIAEWGDYRHKSVNHSKGEFVRYEGTESNYPFAFGSFLNDSRLILMFISGPHGSQTISSNKAECIISTLKKELHSHSGFPYPRFWLWLEEFIYHRNNSGSESRASLETMLQHIGEHGLKNIEDQPHHSVYFDYCQEWQSFCRNIDHKTVKDCDCDAGDIETGDESQDEGEATEKE
jgi:transposase-like protein